MDENYKSKLLAYTVTAVLVFSSVLFITDAQATPSEDLVVNQMYEPDGTPPPRANIAYDMIIEWKNDGSSDYDATVRLYEDCDLNTLATESDTITMGAGQEGSVTLSITFDDDDADEPEVCISGTIYHDGTDYGEFENYLSVEPETGDADLFVEFQMDGSNFAAGENVNVIFEHGNDGTVSTLHPVTFMAYFDSVDDDATNYFDPSPVRFDFISPPPPDAPPESDRMEWPYTIPGNTPDGKYKFTVVIDSDENNTEEDPDLDNNVDVWEVCIGDCSEADLSISEQSGLNSLRVQPEGAVAGMTLSFYYAVTNSGEGDAVPPGPFDDPPREGNLSMGIEVMKCPDGDCTGQIWVPVNTTAAIKTPINSGETMEDDSILGVNWSTSSSDAGMWNIRIVADYEDVIKESNEDNNMLEWFKIHDGYFNLAEQRPDLVISGIDEGIGKVYQDDERIIQVAVSQTAMGDAMADDVKVYLKITDPDLSVIDWFQIDSTKTVGLAPDITFFEYAWTPTKLGYYEFYAYVDKEDEILEWDDANNEYEGDKYVEVFEKLPDLQVTSVSIDPVNDEGYAMVGVSSEVVATIVNSGIRDMTSSEGTKLEVSFYTSAPMATKLATINVDQALAVGESIDISIPFKFLENAQYRVIAKVDEDKLIDEEDENNNEKYKNIYAVSSLDSYVTNFNIVAGDGLAGIDHPLTFDLGMYNVPEEGTYRLHFNISIDGTFGWGEVLALSSQNTTGFYPVGTNYSVSGGYAYIDFNSSYNVQTVVIPWIPDPSRSDTYNVTIEVESDINVDTDNDIVYRELTVEKLTTNILVESIKITDSDGSATIKVTIGYPQGEQSDLNVEVGLLVYRANDYTEGNPPIDSLTVKSIDGILRGDSRPISFTWAVSNGDYIFVAVVDPDNKVKEINEADNSYPSLLTNFAPSGTVDAGEDDDEGLLGLPSISVTIAMSIFGLVALARRRS
jgi:subtilase family serine protease